MADSNEARIHIEVVFNALKELDKVVLRQYPDHPNLYSRVVEIWWNLTRLLEEIQDLHNLPPCMDEETFQ